MPEITIATRGSTLALTQSRWVAKCLEEAHPGLVVHLSVVKTTGDLQQEASLRVIGGKGAFTREVQEAMLEGRADVAVHSLKDLPTEPVPGLRVWAHPEREDPRDAWFGREGLRFADLTPQSTVATGSLRREAQVRAHTPGVSVIPLRGNVDTRIRKFREGLADGMLIAAAGLSRLGRLREATELLEPGDLVPAPGQGILAVEGRDDDATRDLLLPLEDPQTRIRARAERAFLAELGAGCEVPVGALAHVEGDRVRLEGLIASPDGSAVLRLVRDAPVTEAEDLGRDIARRLLAAGGDRVLAAVRGPGP